MPPKEDGTSRSFTFITGNPRSKKNITQIRRHAGQNSGHKASVYTAHPAAIDSITITTPPTSSHPWDPAQFFPIASVVPLTLPETSIQAPASPQRQDGWIDQRYDSGNSSPTVPEVLGASASIKYHGSSLSFSAHMQYPQSWHSATDSRPSQLLGGGQVRGPDFDNPYLGAETPQQAVTGEMVTSATIIEPSSPPPRRVTTKPPSRKLTIRELMNASDTEVLGSGERDNPQFVPVARSTFQAREYRVPSHESSSSSKDPRGMERPYDSKIPYKLQDVTRIRRPAVRRKHPSQISTNTHDDHEHSTLKANISKRRKPFSSSTMPPAATATAAATLTPTGDEAATWRMDKVPTTNAPVSIPYPLTLTKDDSLIEETLRETEAFYSSKFSASWSHWKDENPDSLCMFETTPTTSAATFSGSVTTAAGLIAISRIDSAVTILNQILPSLHDLFIDQHPHLFPTLAEISLDTTTDTSLGRLRSQIKHFAASLSHTVLGPAHPITRLLRLELSTLAQMTRLRELLQRCIHSLHERLFPPASMLTTGQAFHLARVLAQLGYASEASALVQVVGRSWEVRYGRESLMCVLVMVEGAKMSLKAELSLVTLSEEVEAILLDALQRTTTLLEKRDHSANTQIPVAQPPPSSPPPPPPSPWQSRKPSPSQPPVHAIIHTRMACLRTLGRLYAMQGRFHHALQYYTQGVQVGVDELGPAVPAVQLALADLDLVSRMLVLENEAQKVL